MTTEIDITPARLRCGSGFCPMVIYTPADLRCDVVASCPEVAGRDGLLTIVGKQVEHPKAGPGEAAVEIGEEYFSELPEVVRLRERVAVLEKALRPFVDDWGMAIQAKPWIADWPRNEALSVNTNVEHLNSALASLTPIKTHENPPRTAEDQSTVIAQPQEASSHQKPT